MKRMYYASRFARPLTGRDLAHIHSSSSAHNPRKRITGFLVCLGDTFFQLLEGPAAAVDDLYHNKILPDDRHRDILCIKVENGIRKRMFPEWHMKVFDLNNQSEVLPFAFREMLTALLESYLTTARYTQPSVLRMLERGTDRGRHAAEKGGDSAVQRHHRVLTLCRARLGPRPDRPRQQPCGGVRPLGEPRRGEVNKLTGDGVLSYFPGRVSDPAIEAAMGIVREMGQRREKAPANSPHRSLYGGVGLASGLVYEGNIGVSVKQDFAILGNKVNLAARLESMTRELNVRLAADRSVLRRAERTWPFESLGKHGAKGQSKPVEVFTLSSLPRLDVSAVYREIEDYIRAARR